MTSRAKKPKPLSLRDAFETEYARREMERRRIEDETRRQQAQDLADAETLFGALTADAQFLADHGLSADRRRYMVSLDHHAYRIAAYFEAGKASVTLVDKRFVAAAPRKQEDAEGVEATLRVMAQFLADETR